MIARASGALRELTEADLELVRSWRNSGRIRSVMYSDDEISSDGQRRWFQGLKNDPTRRYLIFEANGKAVGVLYFNPIDPIARTATWGFYLGEPGTGAGLGRLLGECGLDFAFSKLSLETVVGETFAFNERGIRLHERLGFRRVDGAAAHLKNGRPEDVVRFSLDRKTWLIERSQRS